MSTAQTKTSRVRTTSKYSEREGIHPLEDASDEAGGEFDLSGVSPPSEELLELSLERCVDTSEKSANVIRIVNALESEVDRAHALSEALERDLLAAQQKLIKETAARAELETRLEALRQEKETASAERFREDIAFVEEERAKAVRTLQQTKSHLSETAGERDSLAAQIASTEATIASLQQKKIKLEGKVHVLEEKLSEVDPLREALEQAAHTRQELESSVERLTRDLDASKAARKALDAELATSRGTAERLHEKLSQTDGHLTALHETLEGAKGENADLLVANQRLERDLKILTMQYETTKDQLAAAQGDMDKVLIAAAGTAKRFRDDSAAERRISSQRSAPRAERPAPKRSKNTV